MTNAKRGCECRSHSRPIKKHYSPTSWLDPRVEVHSSPIEGQGLFAREPIHRGEVVLVLGGRVISDEELRRLSPHSSLAIGEGLNLMQEQDDLAQFGNHSCDPSLWMEDEVTLSARREIAAGEEITVDYGLMTVAPTWEMTCACGSPLCRRRVTGADWQLSQLQERYAGHFSPFINDRIDRLKGSTRDA